MGRESRMALYREFVATYNEIFVDEELSELESIVGNCSGRFIPTIENLAKIKYCGIEFYKFLDLSGEEIGSSVVVCANKKVVRLANFLATFDAQRLLGGYSMEYFKCLAPSSQERVLSVLNEYPFLLESRKREMLEEISKKKASPMILMTEVVFSINNYMN